MKSTLVTRSLKNFGIAGALVATTLPALAETTQFTTDQKPYPGSDLVSNYVTLPSGPRVHFLDEGEGDVPLLLVHGIPTQAYTWRHVIAELSQSNRVIAIDQPNWGLSDKTPHVNNGVPCTGDYAGWIAEFVAELGVEKLRIVAFDMGFVSFLYAARNPDAVDGIAFFETAPGPIPRDLAPPFLNLLLTPEGERLVLEDNYFVETLLLNNAHNGAGDPPFRTAMRDFTDAEAAVYRAPFETEDQRAALLFDQECLGFVGDKPTDPASPERKAQSLAEFAEFGSYLATTQTPRLVLFGNPSLVMPAALEPVFTGKAPPEMSWPSTDTVTIAHMQSPTLHYWPEETNGAPQELAGHIQTWLDTLN